MESEGIIIANDIATLLTLLDSSLTVLLERPHLHHVVLTGVSNMSLTHEFPKVDLQVSRFSDFLEVEELSVELLTQVLVFHDMKKHVPGLDELFHSSFETLRSLHIEVNLPIGNLFVVDTNLREHLVVIHTVYQTRIGRHIKVNDGNAIEVKLHIVTITQLFKCEGDYFAMFVLGKGELASTPEEFMVSVISIDLTL